MPKASIEPIAPELQVYSEKQTADIIGISAWTLARWRKEGRAPPCIWLTETRVGYRRRDVEAWLQSRPTGSRGPKDPKAAAGRELAP